MAERDSLSYVSSDKGTNSIPEGSTLMASSPHKGTMSKYHHIESLDFNMWILGEHKHSAIAVHLLVSA